MESSWNPAAWVIMTIFGISVTAWLLSSSDTAITNVVRKFQLALTGVTHMLLSRDKMGKAKKDPASITIDSAIKPKQIVFIRHGESEWNEVFNRGFGPSFLVRLTRAMLREFMMLTTRDSVFFDSPLSDTGIKQTQELIRFLQKVPNAPGSVVDPTVDKIVAILNGEKAAGSVLTTSNLRRAIATGLITLWERLRQTQVIKRSVWQPICAVSKLRLSHPLCNRHDEQRTELVVQENNATRHLLDMHPIAFVFISSGALLCAQLSARGDLQRGRHLAAGQA